MRTLFVDQSDFQVGMLWAQVNRHMVSMGVATVQGLKKLSSRDRYNHSSLCQVRASSVCSPVGDSGWVFLDLHRKQI